MAAATSEYNAVGWSCSGSVGCPRLFCYDLLGGRVGYNCTSMWYIIVNFIFLTCLQSINLLFTPLREILPFVDLKVY
jgi:hypothetical protein